MWTYCSYSWNGQYDHIMSQPHVDVNVGCWLGVIGWIGLDQGSAESVGSDWSC